MFAVAILNLVPSTRIELVMTGYQPIVIPFNYKGKIEFVSSCPIVIATIHPCNKLERDSVRHLGYLTSAFHYALGGTDPLSALH